MCQGIKFFKQTLKTTVKWPWKQLDVERWGDSLGPSYQLLKRKINECFMGTKYKVFMRVSRNENTEEESNLLLQRCLQKKDTEDSVSSDLVSFLQWTLWRRASSGGQYGRDTLCEAWWKKIRNVGCVAMQAFEDLKELSIPQTQMWKVKVATWEMMLELPHLTCFFYCPWHF